MPGAIIAGDCVRCVHAEPYALTAHRVYRVLETTENGFYVVENDAGNRARYATYRFTADLEVPVNSVRLSSTPLRDAMFAVPSTYIANEPMYSTDDNYEDEDDGDPEDYFYNASRNYCEDGEYLDNGDNDTGTLRERVAPGDILMYLYTGERVRVVRHTTYSSGELHVVPIEHDDSDYFTIYPYCDEHAIVRQRTEIYGQPSSTAKARNKNIKVLTLKDIK